MGYVNGYEACYVNGYEACYVNGYGYILLC